MKFEELFDDISSTKNLAEEFVAAFSESNKKIFLFGCGIAGRLYAAYLDKYCVKIEGVVDNFKTSSDLPYPLFSLRDVITTYPKSECVFLIASPNGREQIQAQLLEEYAPCQIFSFDAARYLAFSDNEPASTKEFLISNREKIYKFYQSLSDEQSKRVLLSVLRGHITADSNDFSSVRTGEFYYPSDIIHFDDNEIMVELGANNGETLKEFAIQCPAFKRAYCFEPDPNSLSSLRSIANQYGGRVKIIEKGAWSCPNTLNFSSDGGAGASKLVPDVQEASFGIEVTAVDMEVSENITYMKMDIEGAELEALKGARQQILRNKPKLAISLYHKNEDIITIPQYLKSLVPEYHFYLRHHGMDDSDTVLYAII